MNFLVDMPLSPTLAAWLCDQGHDAVHAAEVGLARAADIEIIARAQQDGRTIVTADLDYPRLLALARAAEPSLILFRDGDWRDTEIIARMKGILGAMTAEDIARSIIVVTRERIRKTALG